MPSVLRDPPYSPATPLRKTLSVLRRVSMGENARDHVRVPGHALRGAEINLDGAVDLGELDRRVLEERGRLLVLK